MCCDAILAFGVLRCAWSAGSEFCEASALQVGFRYWWSCLRWMLSHLCKNGSRFGSWCGIRGAAVGISALGGMRF